jgi:glutathione S-transferase
MADNASTPPPAKKAKTDKSIDDWSAKQEVGRSAMESAPPDTWQLLYWPAKDADGKVAAGAGRAEYLRVMFEEAGVPYEEVTAGLREFFWEKLDLQTYPTLAPPAIRKGDFILGQTAVCAKHLAIEFGLMPKDLVDSSHADQIVTTVHEYIAEGRMAFHPVKNTMSYHDQKEEAKPYIEAFKTDRLPRYMTNFERFLKANKGGEGFFLGESLSYVDLQVMVMLQVTRSQFPDKWPTIDAPVLKAFLQRMEARPQIQQYLSSGRKQPFAGDSMM